MKRINKIIFSFIVISSFLALSTTVKAEEIFDDVAPFSDEIIDVAPFADEEIYHDINSDFVLTDEKSNIAKPRITVPANYGKIDGPQMIKGEIESGYDVKVYVDGKYVETIDVWESKTGISGFFYEPKQKMSLGMHNIYFVAVKNGVEYGSSEKVNFEVVSGYTVPEILTPYYYADDFSTYVIRGNANIGSKLEVYVDGVKVRYVNSLRNTYFALAVKGLRVGNHQAYVVTYSADGTASTSKTVYFKVYESNSTVKAEDKKEEVKIEPVVKEEQKQEVKENKEEKVEPVKEEKADSKNTAKTEKVKNNDNDGKKDKSILIGIILLIVAAVLILGYLISENREKIKKFVDNLFEEDSDDNKDDNK